MPSPWRPYSVGHKVLVYIFGLVEAVLSVTGTLIWLRKRRAMGVDMASLAIQVFGGMGYVEETGVAQLLRDARIAPIYEGTNGIQAVDLTCRKLDADAHWRDLVDEIEVFVPQLYDTLAWREDFQTMVTALRQAGETVAAMTKMERTHIATNLPAAPSILSIASRASANARPQRRSRCWCPISAAVTTGRWKF